MNNENVRLDNDIITDAQLWKLALRIGKNEMHVVLYNIIEDNSLIYRRIDFDEAAQSQLKSLESAVYENPLLLRDFARIDCVIDTNLFEIVPPEISSTELRERIFKETFPDFAGEIVPCEINENGATILMGVDHEVIGFVRRTFNNPHLHHHLSPLCKYFFHKSKLGNSAKMYACLRPDKVDIMAFSNERLLFANTFVCRDKNDAVYYIMACRQMLKMDNAVDELFLTGNPSDREAIVPMLRRYLAYVMPVIFPSAMFKAGKEAMKAPFDLIVLPLCE